MLGLDYIGRADVLSRFLTDFTGGRLKRARKAPYGDGKFDDNTPPPVVFSINTRRK